MTKNISTEQLFDSQKQSLQHELETLLTEAKERVEEFVTDNLKEFGDFRVWGYTPEHFEVALFNDEKPVFGAHFDVYVRKDYHSKETNMECNIGTCGSFRLGVGNEREMLYLAFAKFITDVREVCFDKYLIRVQNQVDEIWHRFSGLCKQFNKNTFDTGLFD